MAQEISNGNHNSASKPPPTPSPLRFSKFFQVILCLFFFFSSICICLLIFWWICLWLCCFLIDLIIYHSIWLDNMLLQLAFQTDFHLVALLFYPEKLHYWLKIWSNARGVSKMHFLLASCKSIHAKYVTEKLFLL